MTSSFELQPTLEGELIALRPLRASDYDAMFAVAADPLIWEQHPAHDRWQEPVFRRLFEESMASGGALVAIDRSTGQLIGWSRYHGYSADASEVEIGWTFLARKYWGGRYNGEMKRLMIAHALRFVNRIIFVIGQTNIRSQRAVERIGATFAGPMMVDGRPDRVVYEIRRDRSGPGGARPAEEIRTDRLVLRRWKPEDAPLLKDAIDASLEHLQRWMPWAKSEPTPLAGIEERLALFAGNFDRGAEWIFGIFAPDQRRVIGGTGLHPRIGATGLEIGYWIRSGETGNGYATEAAAALTRAGLSLPQIDHVEIRCDPRNLASAAVPQRLGFTHVDTISGQVPGAEGRIETTVWRTTRPPR